MCIFYCLRKSLGRFRRDPREPDEDEALWFDADEDDDEPSPNATIGLAGGVSPCSVLGTLPQMNAAAGGSGPTSVGLGGVSAAAAAAAAGSSLVQSVSSSFSNLNAAAGAAAAVGAEFGEMMAGVRAAGVPKATVLGKVRYFESLLKVRKITKPRSMIAHPRGYIIKLTHRRRVFVRVKTRK